MEPMKRYQSLHLLLFFMFTSLSCEYIAPSSDNPEKKFEFIPEDPAWRLEKLYSDKSE